jgi:recombination protein RecR
MAGNAAPLARLVTLFARLPGIGPKGATRLAHHLLRVTEADARELATAIVEIKEKLFHCSLCRSITEVDPCELCTDPHRDRARLCVVEEPWNILPIERTGEYRGLYHVLLGQLSPQRGIGPDQLAVAPLLTRLDGIDEVILATNPSVEGEATALYLARLLKGRVPHLTRLAFGLPIGGDIEYADEVTLGRSLAGRREIA